jgi:gluconolactonase
MFFKHLRLFCFLIAFLLSSSFQFFRNTSLINDHKMEAEMRVLNKNLDQNDIVAEGATPVLISNAFKFTEGPASDKEGNIYFTDQPNNRIMKYDTDGKLSVFLENAGRSNGMYFDAKGNLVTCADEENQIWSISMDKKVTVLLKDYKGKKLNGPNDLWIDKEGGIFFTDPYYQRDYWTRKKSDLDGQKVYYLPKGKSTPIVVDEMLKQPNGIIGSSDGKSLFVADLGDNKTYKYSIGKKGTLLNRTLFINQGSDGMTLDSEGNLYLTGKGVTVYNPAGEKIKQIDIPAKWTANVCFGGKNKDILFITASESLFKLQMNVKGDL